MTEIDKHQYNVPEWYKPRVYVAGPFFDDAVVNDMNKLKQMLAVVGFDILDPAAFPVLEKLSDAKVRKGGLIYELNETSVAICEVVIALTDNFDSGTMFECGLAKGMNIPYITWSSSGYGMNLMLQKSVTAHYISLQELIDDLPYIRVLCYLKSLERSL